MTRRTLSAVSPALAASALLWCVGTAAAAPPGTPPAGAPGSLVAGFGNAAPPLASGLALGPVGTVFTAVAVQPDGRIVAAGRAGSTDGQRLIVARFTAEGLLDTTFGDSGIARAPATFSGDEAAATGSYAAAVAVLPDGRIVAGGGLRDAEGDPVGLLAVRFTPLGGLDTSFSGDGVASALTDTSRGAEGHALTVDAGGRYVVAGTALDPERSRRWGVIARFSENGAIDAGFASGGVLQRLDVGAGGVVAALAADATGRIVAAGSVKDAFGTSSALAYRITADGAVDTSFSGGQFIRSYARNGSAASQFNAAAVTPDGQVTLAGAAANLSSSDTFATRLDAAGVPVSTFASNGTYQELAADATGNVARTPPPGAAALLETGGSVYLAGPAEASGGYRLLFLTALSRESGAPVPSFGAPVGAEYQDGLPFAAPFGTTYTFMNGASEEPYSGQQGQTLALARTPDGTAIVTAGVAANSLSGSDPTGSPRGVVAMYRAVPEVGTPPVQPLQPSPPRPSVPPGGGTTVPGVPAPAREPAKLSVLGSGIEDGRLRIRIRASSRARGASLSLAFVSGGRRTTLRAQLPNTSGNVEIAQTYRFLLPSSQRRATSGIVEVSSPQTDTVRADSVRLRIARNPAALQRGRTEITRAGNLVVTGTVARRAVGVVRIRLEYVNADGTVGTVNETARIRSGRWSVDERLPEQARRAGGQLSIQYTGHLPSATRGEQTAKQVTPPA